VPFKSFPDFLKGSEVHAFRKSGFEIRISFIEGKANVLFIEKIATNSLGTPEPISDSEM